MLEKYYETKHIILEDGSKVTLTVIPEPLEMMKVFLKALDDLSNDQTSNGSTQDE